MPAKSGPDLARDVIAMVKEAERDGRLFPGCDTLERAHASINAFDEATRASQAGKRVIGLVAQAEKDSQIVTKSTPAPPPRSQTRAEAALAEDYKAKIKLCCDSPKFLHTIREKKACIIWGLKKCVADNESEVREIMETFD